jgi:DNA polymerase sigma
VSFLQHHVPPPWDLSTCDVGQLFIRFLMFYGQSFNYFRTGISVANAGSYFAKTHQHTASHPDQPFLLVIEDPHLSSNNLGRSSYEILRIAGLFRDAAQQILSCLSPSARPLVLSTDRVQSHLIPPYLGKVLLIRNDIVTFRERVASAYSSSAPKKRFHQPDPQPPPPKHRKKM